MAKKSKLLNALDRYKGVDYELERQKKMQKQAEKKKRAKLEKAVNGVDASGRGNGIYGRTMNNEENVQADFDNDVWETEEEEEEEDENEDEAMVFIYCLNRSINDCLL